MTLASHGVDPSAFDCTIDDFFVLAQHVLDERWSYTAIGQRLVAKALLFDEASVAYWFRLSQYVLNHMSWVIQEHPLFDNERRIKLIAEHLYDACEYTLTTLGLPELPRGWTGQ